MVVVQLLTTLVLASAALGTPKPTHQSRPLEVHSKREQINQETWVGAYWNQPKVDSHTECCAARVTLSAIHSEGIFTAITGTFIIPTPLAQPIAHPRYGSESTAPYVSLPSCRLGYI